MLGRVGVCTFPALCLPPRGYLALDWVIDHARCDRVARLILVDSIFCHSSGVTWTSNNFTLLLRWHHFLGPLTHIIACKPSHRSHRIYCSTYPVVFLSTSHDHVCVHKILACICPRCNDSLASQDSTLSLEWARG